MALAGQGQVVRAVGVRGAGTGPQHMERFQPSSEDCRFGPAGFWMVPALSKVRVRMRPPCDKCQHPLMGRDGCTFGLSRHREDTVPSSATMVGSCSLGLKGVKRGVPSHKGPLRGQ